MNNETHDSLRAKSDAAIAFLIAAQSQYQNIQFANSLGAEDVVITDMICRHAPGIGMFSLDTGRLPNETLSLLATMEARYSRTITVYYPKGSDTEALVKDQGINGFYQGIEERKRCCYVRKVAPLQRALSPADAWITGLRKDQSTTRNQVAHSEWDDSNGLQKLNPLVDWSEADVWGYIHAHQLPYNALHDQSFPSIGCAPCTRPIAQGEDVRSGRWWWEQPDLKECGLHTTANLIKVA